MPNFIAGSLLDNPPVALKEGMLLLMLGSAALCRAQNIMCVHFMAMEALPTRSVFGFCVYYNVDAWPGLLVVQRLLSWGEGTAANTSKIIP
jgi:hypothetical protein